MLSPWDLSAPGPPQVAAWGTLQMAPWFWSKNLCGHITYSLAALPPLGVLAGRLRSRWRPSGPPLSLGYYGVTDLTYCYGAGYILWWGGTVAHKGPIGVLDGVDRVLVETGSQLPSTLFVLP